MRAELLTATLVPIDEDGRTVAPGEAVTIATTVGPLHGVCARSTKTSVELIGITRPEPEHRARVGAWRVTIPVVDEPQPQPRPKRARPA